MADLTGRRLGPYDLTRKLGQGGMGAVYVGVHRTLQTPRAIKVLLPHEVDEAVVERFVREGVISASLRHPNIVEIFDVGEEDESHFLVMELIEGESLLQLLRHTGALPLERAVVLLRQIADALDYAHARGVVHRDIKPSNVIVGLNDEVTLIDFGIARALDESRLTRVGVVVGTFEYMAPEVVTEGGGSPGADRYALGIVAYQMLTGRVPFTGESAHSIMYRQVHDPPPPPTQFRPDLPGPAEDALLRQLAKVPDERFPSAQAFVDALGAPPAQPHPETQATSIADITRPGFDRPTPGSGQTPLPRSARVTRPVTAATLTPPGARALPAVPPAPLARRDDARAAGNTEAVFSPTMAAGPATMAGPNKKAGFPIGVVVGLAAVLIMLAAAVVLISPLRQVVIAPFVGVTPTTAAIVERPKPVITPATPTVQMVTLTPQTVTQTPQIMTVTPGGITVTPQGITQTPVPPPTFTPNQRLAQVRDTFEAGNHASALKMLEELRLSNSTLAGLDDAEYDIRIGFARSLFDQGNMDGSFEQFGGALRVRPGDSAAKSGQDQIVLSKNYAIMEAAWDKDDDLAIKALEENMSRDPGYRDTRPKLYALLIRKADRLINAGEREAAFDVLLRALQVLPDGGEAQMRLVSYTPTPAPTPVPPPPPPPPSSNTNTRPSTGTGTGTGTSTKPSTGAGTGSSGTGTGSGAGTGSTTTGPSTGTTNRSNCPGGVCP
jgi:tRNA A-37 threonylcarbamoyl transferase component Bud32